MLARQSGPTSRLIWARSEQMCQVFPNSFRDTGLQICKLVGLRSKTSLDRLRQEGVQPGGSQKVSRRSGVYPVIDSESEGRNVQNTINTSYIEGIYELILLDWRTEKAIFFKARF